MNDRKDGRGVRDARVRFKEMREADLTSTQLQQPGNRRSRENYIPSGNESFLSYAGKLNTADLKRLYKDVRQILKGGDINVNDSDLKDLSEMKVGKVDKPNFPYFILGISIIKDLLDIPANLSVVGVPLSMALSFICSLILFFWIWGKIGGGWWKKAFIQWLWVGLFITTTIELLPVGSIIPATTIFTLMAHYREKKVVKLINLALEEMHRLVVK